MTGLSEQVLLQVTCAGYMTVWGQEVYDGTIALPEDFGCISDQIHQIYVSAVYNQKKLLSTVLVLTNLFKAKIWTKKISTKPA